VPGETAPSASETSSGAITPGAARVIPVPDVWADRLPRDLAAAGGSGNINMRSKQPNAIAVLVTSLMRSLKRIHPMLPTHAKTLALDAPKLKTTQNGLKAGPPILANAPKPNLAGWALGGAAPRRAILGGATPLAAKYAPTVNGLTAGSYR
jgi:hypothetical protein